METRPSMKLRTGRAFYNCGVNFSQTEGQPAGISGDDAGERSKETARKPPPPQCVCKVDGPRGLDTAQPWCRLGTEPQRCWMQPPT